MKPLRMLLVAAGLVILALVLIQPVQATIKTLQEQIAVTIVVNVSPSPTPVGYLENAAPANAGEPVITARLSLERATPALRRAFEAQSLQFERTSSLVVAQAQQPVLIQAEVSPNPNATLLTSNSGEVDLPATAGTTTQFPCAFTVTVDSTKSWSLEQGLSNDFASSFSGTDLANDTYVSTPQPTSTPYVVYVDDGSSWSLLGSGTVKTTYCVTLTLTVPGAVTAGTYSSNAIYTVYF